MAFDFSKLNTEQQKAVFQTKGPVIVTAGAGTGKTRLLTHRIAYLIEKENVNPENILAITFTNKATGEMKERIVQNLDCGYLVTISTFHSLCVKILRKNIDKLDPSYNKFFTIYDDTDQDKILKKILKENEEEDSDFKKMISYYISKAKNEGVSPSEFKDAFPAVREPDDIVKYYSFYEECLKKSNALDFDDLILKTLLLFKTRPDVLEYYQNKFQYIHIDEFQDTNTVQYELAYLLAKKHQNILVVGDEDQSIYGWRGANYKNLFKFSEDFKDAKLFKLEQNYRSTTKILERANKLISNNNERFDKVLYTENAQGDDVELRVFDGDLQEADYVARYIKTRVALGDSLSDFAVLYRVNSVSRSFEKAFVNASIPYRVFGGLKFYSRAEIKNILAYLRLVVNPNDDEAFIRVINFPKRGIGKVSIDNLVVAARTEGKSCLNFVLNCDKEFKNKGIENFKEIMKSLCDNFDKMPIDLFCEKMISGLNLNMAYSSGSEEDLAKLLNIKSFLIGVKEFVASNENATLIDFLENVALASDVQEGESDGVVLATVHAVKGLEFKNVFIVACEENIFPFAKSIEDGSIEEERRLMYVAITRAKQKLIITCARRRFCFGGGSDGFESASQKSRFLVECGLNDLVFEKRQGSFSNSKQTSSYNSYGSNQKSYSSVQDAKDFIKGITQVHIASDLYNNSKTNLSKFKSGVKVFHDRFGEGIIKEMNGNNAVIEFENGRVKELNLEFAPVEILED